MAIKSRTSRQGKLEIDISGSDGNAFVLMAHAQFFAKQIGYTKDQIDALMEDMRSGDYKHLLEVFDAEFGMIVDLVNYVADDDDEEAF